jgi:hypothetical protein
MTAITGKQYTLADFDKLLYSGIPHTLPPEVLAVFAFLEKNVDIPEFSAPTPAATSSTSRPAHHSKPANTWNEKDNRSKPTKRGGGKKEPTSTEDWELMRSFKTTKIEEKTGVEKVINAIRINLNKMSASNYTKQRDAVIQEVRQYVDQPDVREIDIHQIASAIFDISSGNKFFSELYAEFYRELVSEFEVFAVILKDFVEKFTETLHTIEYINPEEDYDGFCRITKNNDRRKSTSMFIVNLMRKGLIPRETVVRIACVFVDSLMVCSSEENQIQKVEEIAENIYIFVSSGGPDCAPVPEWQSTVVAAVVSIANSQVAKWTSMSNRAIFRFMDMVEFVK